MVGVNALSSVTSWGSGASAENSRAPAASRVLALGACNTGGTGEVTARRLTDTVRIGDELLDHFPCDRRVGHPSVGVGHQVRLGARCHSAQVSALHSDQPVTVVGGSCLGIGEKPVKSVCLPGREAGGAGARGRVEVPCDTGRETERASDAHRDSFRRPSALALSWCPRRPLESANSVAAPSR